MLNTESVTWKDVPGLPYEAGSNGHVRVKRFVASMPKGGVRSYGGKGGPGSWDGNRYITMHRGLKKTFKVARLVCLAFHGEAPVDKPVVMHIDENARNNRPENLRWGTQKENLNAPGFIEYCSWVCRTKMSGQKVAA